MNMASVNERDLLAAATQGSQVAYRELIHLHQAAVYRFAWAMIGEEHAQTVTENAFITAWRQLEFLPAINLSFHTHLLQLVCIDCTELAKRQRRHRVNLNAQTDEDTLNFPFGPLRYDPRTNMEHIALQADIEDALHALPMRLRQILLLHEMGHVPDTQIADILGGTAQAIHADLLRARALVRRQIMLSGGFFPASTEGNETAPAQFRACKSYLSTLSAATDGLCTSEEKRALSAHLAECPGCRGYYGAMSAIHHGLAVMKHEVPGDMASYIIHRIQQESGPGDFSANSGKQKKRWHFRPAIGRFTIIGLCLALVLLAYSGGILERGQAQLPPPQQNQDQTLPQQANENETTALQQPDSTPEDLPPAQPPVQPPETSSDNDETAEPPSGESTAPEDGSSSIVPGGGISDTLVPAGETYRAVYTTDASAASILAQYSTVTFTAALADGVQAVYYVVPAESAESVSAALSEAGISCSAYTEDPSVLSSASEALLYILLD